MCDFFDPEMGRRPEGAIFIGLAFAISFSALIYGALYLALTRTGAGQYIVTLLAEALR